MWGEKTNDTQWDFGGFQLKITSFTCFIGAFRDKTDTTVIRKPIRIFPNLVAKSSSWTTETPWRLPHLRPPFIIPLPNSRIKFSNTSGLLPKKNKDGDGRERRPKAPKKKNDRCLWKFTTLPGKFTTRRACGLVAGGHVDMEEWELISHEVILQLLFSGWLTHLTLVTQTLSWLLFFCGSWTCVILPPFIQHLHLHLHRPPASPLPKKHGVSALRRGCARRANVPLDVRENEGWSHSRTVGLPW